MTLRNFITRLNWRQIVIHFVAFYFFFHAFDAFSYLYDTKILDILRYTNNNERLKVLGESVTRSDFYNFIFWTHTLSYTGLLVAFIISLIISIKRNWFWINSLLTLILAYFFNRFDLLEWNYLKILFIRFGRLLNDTRIELIINGTILLALGVLIFFLRQSNEFIKKSKLATG